MRPLRRLWWSCGTPVRGVLVAAIHVYRATLSGWLGGQCRFYPTCSRYAEEAIRVHGATRGTGMAMWRIARCHPFGVGGVEHAPPASARAYDDVIQDPSVDRSGG